MLLSIPKLRSFNVFMEKEKYFLIPPYLQYVKNLGCLVKDALYIFTRVKVFSASTEFSIEDFSSYINTVENSHDQMTGFVTIFSSASGKMFSNISIYTYGIFSNKAGVHGKSSSFQWCERYSAIWSVSLEHSDNVFCQNSCTLSRWHRLTAKTFFESSREWDNRRIALTPSERAWFSVYSALYLNKFHSVFIYRDILKKSYLKRS